MAKKRKAYYEITYRGDVIGKVPLKSGQKFNVKHKYFQKTTIFNRDNKAKVIWYLIDEHCSNIGYSRKEWKKTRKPFRCTFTNPNGTKWNSKPINYSRLNDYIKKNYKFEYADFDFPSYNCRWLDLSIDMGVNFFLKSSPNAGTPIQDWTLLDRFGHDVHLRPQIDREGHLISSFLPGLIRRIIYQRNELINNSNEALEINWLFRLKELIINSISLIDITLLQLYTKAEYLPESTWTFDKKILGEKHSRRITDKLKWVRQISGNELNITQELESLKILKEVRNHLSHFDPPCFAVTLEEIAEWLNMILDIATINYKIRMALNVKLSEELMSFMVQPLVEFVPQSVFTERTPLNKRFSGYSTSKWPSRKLKEHKTELPYWKRKIITLLQNLIDLIEK